VFDTGSKVRSKRSGRTWIIADPGLRQKPYDMEDPVPVRAPEWGSTLMVWVESDILEAV